MRHKVETKAARKRLIKAATAKVPTRRILEPKKPLGVILYQGPSMIDGSPIVVIATGFRASNNRKTGRMIQTWIIRSDIGPTVAIKSGQDFGICGGCKHRGNPLVFGQKRTCYVNVGQGPLAVFNAFQRGAYTPVENLTDAEYAALFGQMIRFGSYGDPAAAPVLVWRRIAGVATGWTGYTHQWRMAIASGLRPYCMASADTAQDAADAHRMGWRTFRVAMPLDVPKVTGEASCPASKEMGAKLTCIQCKACNGTATAKRGSIVIQAHGGFAVMHAARSVGSFAIAA